ncbi:hypothetical protein ACMFMG_005225 [Clarireedia jacksonii]
MAGGPAAGRGRGGKFKKFTRGGMQSLYLNIRTSNKNTNYHLTGGKHFSRDLRPLDADGNEIRERNADDSSEEEEESEEEESSEEEEAEEKPAMTREERRAAAKARKEAAIAKKNKKVAQPGDLPTDSEEESEDDDMPANPNHSKAARKQAAAAPVAVEETAEDLAKMSVNKAPAQLSRKEREALEKQQAHEAYMKRHLAGETDKAKEDMKRLEEVRRRREEAAAQKAVSILVLLLAFDILICDDSLRKSKHWNSKQPEKSKWNVKRGEDKLLWDLLQRRRARNERFLSHFASSSYTCCTATGTSYFPLDFPCVRGNYISWHRCEWYGGRVFIFLCCFFRKYTQQSRN